MKFFINVKVLMSSLLLALSPIWASAQKFDDYKDSYYFNRGMELMFDTENPDLDGAISYLERELQEHPKNGYAYLWLAAIYNKEEKQGEALENINKAISLLKKDRETIPSAYRFRADIYVQLGKDAEAEKDWAAALKADKDDYNTLLDRGNYYYDKGLYDLSIADYERATSIKPGEPKGYMGKARNFMAQKKYDDAIEVLDYCIKLSPDLSLAYSYKAEALLGQGKYSEASDNIIKALSMNEQNKASGLLVRFKSKNAEVLLTKLRIQEAKEPNDFRWPYCQGILLENNNEYADAAKAYLRSNEKESFAMTLERVSLCYSELGEYDLAMKYIDRAIQMDSTDTDMLIDKAEILYDNGQANDAIDLYSKLIALQPDHSGHYYRRGFMKDNIHDIDGAIEDYSTSIILDPGYAYAYLGRGDMYKLKGDEAAARSDYQKAIQLDTAYGEFNVAMFAYLGLGEKEKAIAFEDSVLAHSSSCGNLYDAACLYCRMGDEDKAMDYLRQCLEKGFARFSHIMLDDDLDALKDRDDFKALIKEYENKAKKAQKADIQPETPSETTSKVSEIPFTRHDGVCQVKCKINDLPLSFVFDTGASIVSISSVEASFMFKNGYLKPSDVVGSARFSDANGDISEGTVVVLKKVTFGDEELTNVKASVVHNQRAPLLLGQTVLTRLGTVEIDNKNNVIRIKK